MKPFFIQDVDVQIPVNFLGRSTTALIGSTEDEVGVFPCGKACEIVPSPRCHSTEPMSEATTHAQANTRNNEISSFCFFSSMLLQVSCVLLNGEQKVFMKPQTFVG